jgi:hypothetical protein
LEIFDPLAPPSQWDESTSWRAGATLFGTPAGHVVVIQGDMDIDGDVDFDDIDPFVIGLLVPSAYETMFGEPPAARGDGDGDGVFDFDDIPQFVRALAGKPPVGPGDMDGDGDVDLDDIDSLILGLTDPDLYQSTHGMPATVAGDLDQDGDLDFDDITPLVDILKGTTTGALGTPSRRDLQTTPRYPSQLNADQPIDELSRAWQDAVDRVFPNEVA